MENKTAVEWLIDMMEEQVSGIDHVNNRVHISISFEDFMYYKKQAKEMEREQIKELEAALVKRDEDLIGVSAQLSELEKKHVGLWADLISQPEQKEDESVNIRATFTTKTEPMSLRPAIEFIIELPEPYRKAALNAIDKGPLYPDKPVENISEALSSSFRWGVDFLKWAELGAAIMSGKKWPDPSLFK